MGELVEQERVTANPVSRSQISVAVSQGNVAGSQTDVEVDQVWNEVERWGADIEQRFSQYGSGCGSSEELKARGASQESIAAWERACRNILAQKPKFDSEFKQVIDQRADLKAFQAVAGRRREALVQEATRLQ